MKTITSGSFSLTLMLAASLMAGANATAGPAGSPATPGVVPPQAKAFGKTYGDWSEAWWKWTLSIPAAHNPALDTSGASDAVGQSGPVWFLPVTGAFGEDKERTSHVPVSRAILVPLGIYFNDYPCGPDFEPPPGQSLEQFLTEGAAWIVNHVTELTAEVDGVPVRNPFSYRAVSGFFSFIGDPSVSVLDPCVTGEEQVGVADGYWLLLEPLNKGTHIIRWNVRIQIAEWGLDLSQSTTYHLVVE